MITSSEVWVLKDGALLVLSPAGSRTMIKYEIPQAYKTAREVANMFRRLADEIEDAGHSSVMPRRSFNHSPGDL